MHKEYNMKKIILGLALLTSTASFANSIGATLLSEQVHVKMVCAQEEIQIERCNQLNLVLGYAISGTKVYELPAGDVQTIKEDFASFIEENNPPGKTRLQNQMEGLTVLGKALIGWYKIPQAIKQDREKQKKIELNNKDHIKYLDLLSNASLKDEIVVEKVQTPLFYFTNRIKHFIEVTK